jgi:hypothetical protein
MMSFPFLRRNTHRLSARQTRSFVPQFESLEDRTVLSTLTVLNALDRGAGSLRDTITNARSGDTIVFAPSLDGQTITLTSDQLTLNKSLDIEGPGASLLAISGNDTNRVFNINEGFTVTIAGLTIKHGRAVGGGDGNVVNGGGGGILNTGSTLTLANDVFSDNVSFGTAYQASGGAINNAHPNAILTVTDCRFLNNVVDGHRKNANFAEGGAIYAYGSTVTVCRSTFIGNKVMAGDGGVTSNGTKFLGNANGGALHSEGGSTLTVSDSTFMGNQAIAGSGGSAGQGVSLYIIDSALGGAIANDEDGILAVSGSTFSCNKALGGSNATGISSGFGYVGLARGGAVNNLGVATVTNTSFDHNEAVGGSNNTGGTALLVGDGFGGGIANASFAGHPVTLTVTSCTLTDNRASGGAGNTGGVFTGDGGGGGLENEGGGATTATVTGSTFTCNQAMGGRGVAGGNGGDGLGGGLANILGTTLTIAGCTISGNQAVGGIGGTAGNGGSGFGGGLFNDGQSTLTVHGSTVTANVVTGGTAGAGGSAGQGIGGGAYLASGGVVCLDVFTAAHIYGNSAATSNNDVFGVFTIWP